MAKQFVCSICGKTSHGFGNNPQPVRPKDAQRCCDRCNSDVVIPARLKQMLHDDSSANQHH
jgi:hypothetical protein